MTHKVADAVLGKLSRMYADVIRRLGTGTLDPNRVVRAFQIIIENKDDFSAPKIGTETRFVRMTASNSMRGDNLPSNIVLEFSEMPESWDPVFGHKIEEGHQIRQTETEELVEALFASVSYYSILELKKALNARIERIERI